MAETNILTVSLREYKKQIDDLRASLLGMEKGTQEYEKTAQQLREKQSALNEVMRIGKESTSKAAQQAEAAAGSYNALSQEMTRLKQEWKATNDEATRNELGVQINSINEQLKAFDETIGNHQRNVGDYAIAGESMKSQLKGMQEEMAKMVLAGQGGSRAYQELAKKAGDLSDALQTAKGNVKQMANDTRSMAIAADVAKTAVAGFTAIQGAIAAFGGENEKVAQTLAKVQGAMAMLQGVEQVQKALVDEESLSYQALHSVLQLLGWETAANTEADTASIAAKETKITTAEGETAAEEANTAAQMANKDATLAGAVAADTSSVAVKGEGVAMQATTVSTNGATLATKLFRTALMATGIGAIIVLLGTLAANFDKICEAIKEAIGIEDKYNTIVEDTKEIVEGLEQECKDEITLMEARGATQVQVASATVEYNKTILDTIDANIAAAKSEIMRIKSASKFAKFIGGAFAAVIKAVLKDLEMVTAAVDAVFGTSLNDRINGWIDKVGEAVEDWIDNTGDLQERIDDMQKQRDEAAKKLHDSEIALQAAQIKAQRKAAEDARKLAEKNAKKAAQDAAKRAKEAQAAAKKQAEELERQSKEIFEANKKGRQEALADWLAEIDATIQGLKDQQAQTNALADYADKLEDAMGTTTIEEQQTRNLKTLKREKEQIDDMTESYEGFVDILKMDEKEEKELASLKQKNVAKLTEIEKSRLEELENKEKDLNEKRKKYQAEIEKLKTQSSNKDLEIEIENAKIETENRKKENDNIIKQIENKYEKLADDIEFRFDQIHVGIKPQLDLEDIEHDIENTLGHYQASYQKGLTNLYDRLYEINDKEFKKLADKYGENVNKYFDKSNTEEVKKYLDGLFDIYDSSLAQERTWGQDLMGLRKEEADNSIELEIMLAQTMHNIIEQENSEKIKKQEEALSKMTKGTEEYMTEEEKLNELKRQSAQETADFIIAQQDRINKKNKQDTKVTKEWTKVKMKTLKDLSSAYADLFGGIADLMEANIDDRVKHDHLSEEEAKKEYKRVQGVQIAELWINTIGGAAGAFMQDMKNYPSPYNYILAAIDMTTALTTGVAQMKKIQNTDYNYSGGDTSSDSSASISTASVSPLLNEQIDQSSMTKLNTDYLSEGTDTRCYILQSDITKSNTQVVVRQNSTTF